MTDHSLPEEVRQYLRTMIAQGHTVIVCGTQGRGTSTLLSSLRGEK